MDIHDMLTSMDLIAKDLERLMGEPIRLEIGKTVKVLNDNDLYKLESIRWPDATNRPAEITLTLKRVDNEVS